jgi:hypothetical protein
MKRIIFLLIICVAVLSCTIQEEKTTETRTIEIIDSWNQYQYTQLGEIYIGKDIFYADGTFEEISGLSLKTGTYEFSQDYIVMDYDGPGDFEGNVKEIILCECFLVDTNPVRKFIKISPLGR